MHYACVLEVFRNTSLHDEMQCTGGNERGIKMIQPEEGSYELGLCSSNE